MIIRKTKEEDIPFVNALYLQAMESLRERSVDQWQNGYPNEASIMDDIKQGISIVVELDGNVIATAAAYVGEDPPYRNIVNGAWKSGASTYGIIHRIAVDNSKKTMGIASKIFEYCKSISIENNCTSMRCDTHIDNIPMQKALAKNGYQYCGIIYLEDGQERNAYECILGRMDA